MKNLIFKSLFVALGFTLQSISFAQGTYKIPVDYPYPPATVVCHADPWLTYTNGGSSDVRFSSLPNFNPSLLPCPKPHTSGYDVTVYWNDTIAPEPGTISVACPIKVRSFIEYVPAGTELPGISEATYIVARKADLRVVLRAGPKAWGLIQFGPYFFAEGEGDPRQDYVSQDPEPDDYPWFDPSDTLYRAEPNSVTQTGTFVQSNGRWISQNTLISNDLTVTLGFETFKSVDQNHMSANFQRIFRLIKVNGNQVNSGWVPADIDADGEIGPDDFERVVNGFGTNSGSANFDRFADTDCDGEIGPDDFEAVVSNFGAIVDVFAMNGAVAPGLTNTDDYFNWLP